jgi:hypothetical protein
MLANASSQFLVVHKLKRKDEKRIVKKEKYLNSTRCQGHFKIGHFHLAINLILGT